MDRRICDYFEAHRAAFLEDLRTLVAVPSDRGAPAPGAPYGPGPRAVLDEAKRICEAHGLAADIRGDRVLVAELGEGEAELGILAHLDVVPPAGEWTVTGPWEMREVDGVLYGRGVIDDKGPAVAALYALLCARDLGLIKKKVQLILGSDEENGSSDIAWYMERHAMPPRVFTPDANFPLVNIEKGHMFMAVTAPLAGEGLHVTEIAGGSVANAVPASARAVLSDGTTIEAQGRAAHASLPDEGDNAICKLLEELAGIEGANFDVFRALSRVLPHGDTGGHAFGGACQDAISGALTVNLGVISGNEAEGLRAVIDCRVPVCGDGHAIADALRAALGGAAQVEVLGLSGPHHTPAESDLVRGLLKIYEDYTGEKGEALAIGGGTYVHEVAGGVAFGCEFPGSEGHMHEPDERASVAELLLSGEMFAQAVADFCG